MLNIKLRIFVIYLLTSSVVVSSGEVKRENSTSEELNENGKVAFLLRLQWPPGKCVALGSRCKQGKVEDTYWTIHGLWPLGYCQPGPGFNYDELTDSLTEELNTYWINIKSSETNREFWKSEYEKHGCATNWDQSTYFRQALDLYQQYNPGEQLSKVGVTPGGSYSEEKFESAFDNFVQLRCNEDSSIEELEICFDQEYNVINCDDDQQDACSGGISYLKKDQEEEPNTNFKIKLRVSW